MPGPNLTGTPNTDDYVLGRGIVSIAILDATGLPIKWRDLGNAPEFSVTADIETLQHFSSRTGRKIIDKEVVLSDVRGLNFTLDEGNHENFALLFGGTKVAYTNGSVAGFAEYLMVANGNIEAGRWYDIVSSTGVRCYDIGTLTIATNAGTPVVLVLGTNYEVDSMFGRFRLIPSAAITTAIGAGQGLTVALAARPGAKAVNEVRALTVSSQTVAVKFISENAVDGTKQEFSFHKVDLQPNGNLDLIADDWMKMSFQGKCQTNEAFPTSKTFSLRTIAAV